MVDLEDRPYSDEPVHALFQSLGYVVVRKMFRPLLSQVGGVWMGKKWQIIPRFSLDLGLVVLGFVFEHGI